ncbi:helix-turn-helix domain-containing protein [Thermoanaerobacterium sp. DL9XJH110]|uniref:helix-turn-helix domain-containing protein n=1 Tax=Thermoanaerobacterium sp. DL9XJH110 TaxID=3386643 RepID=UPI003BB4E3C5
MTLGEVIKKYREENNLSLREFADKCGLSHAYIAKLEEGKDPRSGKNIEPTLDTVKRISEAINLPLDELLQMIGYIEPDTPTPASTDKDPTLDDEIMAIMRDLGPDITLQFYDLKGMTDEEKENLKIFLQGLKARREQKKKEGTD